MNDPAPSLLNPLERVRHPLYGVLRYLKHGKPVPDGWLVVDDLQGTHHGEYARIIAKEDSKLDD